MPAFLIISGYLANTQKDVKSFLLKILWIFIPYACMETGYVVMSHFLPVRESVAEITLSTLFHKIFFDPIGPYWYLHTLILCSLIHYAVFRCTRLTVISRLVITGSCFFALSYWAGLMNFANAAYFLAGAAVGHSGRGFTQTFQSTFLSIVPLTILCSFPENLNRSTLAGFTITYLFISLFLSLYPYLPKQTGRIAGFIGQNTLVILLFSPIFTITSKLFLPMCAFDATGMLFLVIATSFTIGGSICLAWAMDKLNLSRFFFGKRTVLRL